MGKRNELSCYLPRHDKIINTVFRWLYDGLSDLHHVMLSRLGFRVFADSIVPGITCAEKGKSRPGMRLRKWATCDTWHKCFIKIFRSGKMLPNYNSKCLRHRSWPALEIVLPGMSFCSLHARSWWFQTVQRCRAVDVDRTLRHRRLRHLWTLMKSRWECKWNVRVVDTDTCCYNYEK